MKARELLKQEHPNMLSSVAWGGCVGCPEQYGYDVPAKCVRGFDGPIGGSCTDCWDQEIPGTEPVEEPAEQPVEEQKDFGPVVFIAGPITGVDKYWEAFEAAEDRLILRHHIPLSPATLPVGMTNAQYERICLAMIDCADAVLFLPGWERSRGATLEHHYCAHVGKPIVYRVEDLGGGRNA